MRAEILRYYWEEAREVVFEVHDALADRPLFAAEIHDADEWWLYAALIPLAGLWAAQEERAAHDEDAPAHDPAGATRAVRG